MKKKFKPKAILFDYDGVIVDSERLCFMYYPIIYKQYGLKLNKKQALALRSAGYPARDNLLKKWYGIKKPRELIFKIEHALFNILDSNLKTNPIVLKPNVKQVLQKLSKKKIPMYIVSGTPSERIAQQTKALGVYKYFTKVFCIYDVKYGKPYPDVYLKACENAKLSPQECVAIEDSPNGIISACTAGCKTIMVPDLSKPTKQMLKKYDFVVTNTFKDLLKLI